MTRIFSVWAGGGALLFAVAVIGLGGGCATSREKGERKDDRFTSGSPAADRRAENAVPDDNGSDREEGDEKKEGESKPQTLYQRLGGEEGIRRIVDDFVQRVLEDPRVNWTRAGVSQRKWFRTVEADGWQATPENIERLKLHFVQFITTASGGPAKYDGKPIKPTHSGMQISKAEFDATMGDLRSALDKHQVANDVQEDLISIFESTRRQIVVER